MATYSPEDPRHGAIQASFSPRIAIFASQDVDEACRKNNLTNFVDLLRPFEYIDRVTVRHSNYSTTTLNSLRLSFFNVDQFIKSESQPSQDKDWLDDAVDRSVFTDSHIQTWTNSLSSRPAPLPSPNSTLLTFMRIKREHEWLGSTQEEVEDYPQPSTPWYIAFLNLLFEHRPLVEYDHTSHPLAAMIVVSTNHPEPLNQFSTLYEKSGKDGSGWPTKDWLETGSILRYYLLVHEINDEPDGGKAGAIELFDAIKRAYGLNCGLICINSEKTEWLKKKRIIDQDPNFISPESKMKTNEDHWSKFHPEKVQVSNQAFGEFFSDEDVLGLKVMLREFTLQSLVPHIERCVQQWNDSLAASRKGITGRIFSVGKKYFSKVPGSGGSLSSSSPEYRYNPNTCSYPHQSQEAQTRRLADFSFMLGDYKFASQMYDYLRKDAFSDKAWSYYTSATQMIGLCTLLQSSHNQRSKLNVDLQRFLFDHAVPGASASQLRMVMVYYEMAKAVGSPHLMSTSLIRVATLYSALISGLIYEQVSRIVSPRQAALYIVLAAHQYQQAQQDWLSKLCLRQCPPFNAWSPIEDYLDDRLGCIAELESAWSVAALRYWSLIRRRIDCGAAADDEVYVTKFRSCYQKAIEVDPSLIVPGISDLTLFDVEHCKIHVPWQNHLKPHSGVDAHLWDELISRYSEKSYLLGTFSDLNTAIVNEPFYLELSLKNPLQTSIKITNLHIQVNHLNPLEQPDNVLESLQIEKVEDVELSPLEMRKVSVTLICREPNMKFEIVNVEFKFDSIIHCSQSLKKKGKRLQATLSHRLGRFYSNDQSMIVHSRGEVPILELIGTENLPTEIYLGESFLANLSFRNVGKVEMKGLRCVMSHDTFFRFCSDSETTIQTHSLYETNETSNEQTAIETPNHLLEESPVVLASKLESDGVAQASIVCRGEQVGQHLTCWLFAFQNPVSEENLSYRHVQRLNVLPSLTIKPFIRPSITPDAFYLLTLEFDSLEMPEDIEIYQVSTISTHWSSKCIHFDSESSSLVHLTKEFPVSHMIFEVKPQQDFHDDRTEAIMLQQLKKLLKKEKLDADELSASTIRSHLQSIHPATQSTVRLDTPALLNSILSTHRNSRRKTLQSHFTTMTRSQIPCIFPLTCSRSLEVLIFWRIKSSGRLGHHHVTDLKFGSTIDLVGRIIDSVKDKAGGMYQETQLQQKLLIRQWQNSEYGQWQDPISIDVTTNQQFIEWDFNQKGPLAVPVKFVLKNNSTNREVRYNLKLLREDLEGRSKEGRSGLKDEREEWMRMRIRTDWVGRLNFNGMLKRLERIEIESSCWFFGAGMMSIGDWECEITYDSIPKAFNPIKTSSLSPPITTTSSGPNQYDSSLFSPPIWQKFGDPILISVADQSTI